MHVLVMNRELLLRIIDNDVGILTYCQASLVRTSEYLSRIEGAKLNCLREGYDTLVGIGKHVRIHILYACTSVRDLAEVILAPILLCLLENKGAVVSREKLMERLGITKKEEVVAFGDNCNDVSMLLEAGKSYAVTTAREEAKQAARYVLEKPGPDSVLNVLKMILEL